MKHCSFGVPQDLVLRGTNGVQEDVSKVVTIAHGVCAYGASRMKLRRREPRIFMA